MTESKSVVICGEGLRGTGNGEACWICSYFDCGDGFLSDYICQNLSIVHFKVYSLLSIIRQWCLNSDCLWVGNSDCFLEKLLRFLLVLTLPGWVRNVQTFAENRWQQGREKGYSRAVAMVVLIIHKLSICQPRWVFYKHLYLMLI